MTSSPARLAFKANRSERRATDPAVQQRAAKHAEANRLAKIAHDAAETARKIRDVAIKSELRKLGHET